jgi:hypothetical protein
VYQFAGFFAKPVIDLPEILPEGAVWRTISIPFQGVGVRLAALLGESPEPRRVNGLLEQLGLQDSIDWLYLTYVCWGGQLDYVYGLGVRGGQAIGPIEESDEARVDDAYLELMGQFGVEPADARRFPPFIRGFWGED